MRISDWSSDVCSSDLKIRLLALRTRVAEISGCREQFVEIICGIPTRRVQVIGSFVGIVADNRFDVVDRATCDNVHIANWRGLRAGDKDIVARPWTLIPHQPAQ